MALLYIDGFDHYSNATGAGNRVTDLAPADWAHLGSTSSLLNDTNTMPELGTRGLQVRSHRAQNGNSNSWLTLLLPYPIEVGDTIGFGAHVLWETMPVDNATTWHIFWLGSRSASTVDEGRLGVRLTAGGVLELRSGMFGPVAGPGTLLATGTQILASSVLYHIECAVHLHASDGWFELRVNGQTALRYDGPLNLPQTSLCFSSLFTSTNGIAQTGPITYYDNLYIWDDTGDVNNTFLGERNIFTIFPSSDELPQDWVLSDGTDAFDLLDGVPPDPENDYIESATASEISKFGTDDLPSMDISVIGVQTTIQGYKTGTSDTDVDIGLDIDSDLDVGTSSLAQDQAMHYRHITEVHPDTGEQLTPSEVQSALIHIERTL